MRPLSLYIHMPFCERKCFYCDFLSFESNEEKQKAYIDALISEIEAYSNLRQEFDIKSIFFGGGTPSIVQLKYMVKIFESLHNKFSINNNAEITIEVNPGTVNKEKLEGYKQLGINRLSIGLQATDNQLLKKIGRIHDYNTFLDTYYKARELGFNNINIDLIFGLPDQDLSHWEQTLNKVLDLEPEHLSCYGLIIEENTPFYAWYDEGKLESLNEDLERDMYHLTLQKLRLKGYCHYEISNFSKPNYESYHNLTYWVGREYLGLGLGAASYLNKERYKNTSQIETYISNSREPSAMRRNQEKLTMKQEMEEYMFLGLRLIKGISIEEFRRRFHQSIDQVYGDAINPLIRQKLLVREGDRLFLSNKGIDVSNYVFEQFIE